MVFSGSSTNKTDRHDITEILLKVALNNIKQTNKSLFSLVRASGLAQRLLFTMLISEAVNRRTMDK